MDSYLQGTEYPIMFHILQGIGENIRPILVKYSKWRWMHNTTPESSPVLTIHSKSKDEAPDRIIITIKSLRVAGVDITDTLMMRIGHPPCQTMNGDIIDHTWATIELNDPDCFDQINQTIERILIMFNY